MRVLPILLVIFLSACVAGGAEKAVKPTVPAQNPIIGGPIVVTTLDSTAQDQPNVARPKPKPVVAAPTAPIAKPQAPAPEPTAAQVDETAPAALPQTVSAAEIKCVKQGGTWGPAGKAGETCIKLTKDSGKQCDAESDCEGYCLARSRTCAPFRPMFGCNEILQDNGVQVTLCID